MPHDHPATNFARELSVEFTSRLTLPEDVAALTVLMDRAIAELQRAFLDEAQIASSRAIMGIDTQLIDDRTFFVVESGTDIAGCGGWSRRATLYGGNQTPGRDSTCLTRLSTRHASERCTPTRPMPDAAWGA